MPDELLTTAQAAKLLGINARTLLRYIDRGLLRPTLTLPSGHHRWTEADIRAQLDALRRREEDKREGDDGL